jgi:hypothetical protein
MQITSKYIWLIVTVCLLAVLTYGAAPSMSIRLVLPQQTVKAGSKVYVKIHLKNEKNEKRGMEVRGRTDRNFSYEVRDQNGKRPPLTELGRQIIENYPYPMGGSITQYSFEPGEAKEESCEITSLFDLSQPGNYTIQVQRWDPDSKAVVKSNVVALTVTE